MGELRVCLPDGVEGDYEYSTMSLTYTRTGEGKNMRTVLTFGDAHGCYPFEVTTKEMDGYTNAAFEVEAATITISGEYESCDLINLFRKVIEHHDMQRTILHGKKEKING